MESTLNFLRTYWSLYSLILLYHFYGQVNNNFKGTFSCKLLSKTYRYFNISLSLMEPNILNKSKGFLFQNLNIFFVLKNIQGIICIPWNV